ncbi:MAG: bifunctional D-glycero-beta-D-manno-heptose-7-phosphate kinase/D-glycero-beta-D-manno-heptose 1-phosphate adenylyltransferase HldE [Pseudohongiellaceae bacterium]
MALGWPPFQQARVLVVGDVMLDRYWHGSTSRISPEAPVPVVRVGGTEDRPGGAANVALNIAALGAAASLTGITGEDEAANILGDRLQAAGVRCDFQRSATSPTITKLRVISRQQQLLRADFEEPFPAADIDAVTERALRMMPAAGALILSDYDKGAIGQPHRLIDAARRQGIPAIVDPKGRDFSRYRGATVLTPNLGEFENVVGACATEAELVEKGLAMIESLSLQALLITRGEHGMTLLQAGRSEFHLPARAREVFDVTGAGDTVISVLATTLSAGGSLEQGTSLANIAAGLAVGRLGTAAISAPELRRAVQLEQGSARGVMSAEQLAVAVEDARAHGERIVFTNGCFDIIHAGHVGYLAEARKLGDRLIVAVNDDDSVRRLKGQGRPVNPLDRRMAVLSGLEAVDWVVGFAEDTPEPLLALLKPDVLVKGGDYSEDQVVGAGYVNGYGGEVRVLAFLDDCSTSAIVQRLSEDGSIATGDSEQS